MERTTSRNKEHRVKNLNPQPLLLLQSLKHQIRACFEQEALAH